MTAPVGEIGYAARTSVLGWMEMAEDEPTPELRWPDSIKVYDAMRSQDSQVGSVLRAVTYPVRRTPWRINQAGARDEVTEFVADNLGLPIVGAEPRPLPRTRDRFSWDEHLRLALLMLPFGHAYFEQVYRITDNGTRARLRKLAPRLSKTIENIEVADDGGLVSITQFSSKVGKRQKPIPVDRLVAYVLEREGGNWLGRSVLRGCYKNWLIKDRLLRVDAQTIERNGMGIPLYRGAPGEKDLGPGLQMAKSWRAGNSAGSAVADGADLVLRGVEGDLPTALPSIRYHDEQIGRSVLAHFLNLGSQTGSWALGTTFADFFTLSLQTLAQEVADIASQHVVEDLVDHNFGEDEPAPLVTFDEIGSRQAATAQALKWLVEAGILRPDRSLEEDTRQQYGLPSKDSPAPAPADDGSS
ncbi:phage portal protein family protein [Micromonospora sp. NPDC005163]